MKNQMRPIHPGEILREEYLVPLGLRANALAQRSEYQPTASTRLWEKSELSQQIRRYVSRALRSRGANEGGR
jgi:plasmid maintenance system antidote protein VapI